MVTKLLNRVQNWRYGKDVPLEAPETGSGAMGELGHPVDGGLPTIRDRDDSGP
jgi:hypothetical protein